MVQLQLDHCTQGWTLDFFPSPLSLSFCSCKMGMLLAFCSLLSIFKDNSVLPSRLLSLASGFRRPPILTSADFPQVSVSSLPPFCSHLPLPQQPSRRLPGPVLLLSGPLPPWGSALPLPSRGCLVESPRLPILSQGALATQHASLSQLLPTYILYHT